jgi:TPR repeat protein
MAAGLETLEAVELIALAEGGVAAACETAGWRFTYGTHDFPKDWELAQLWLIRSAELGGAAWKAMVAELMLAGHEPFDPDERAALVWFRQAADEGDYSAKFHLAIRLADQTHAIATYLEIAADPDLARRCWEPALELLGMEDEERRAYMRWFDERGCRIARSTRRVLIERRSLGRPGEARDPSGWRAPWQ